MDMQRTKHTAEFKAEAVKQVVDKGHAVVDVATRLGLSEGLLYTWVRKSKAADGSTMVDMRAMQAELVKLKAELRRTTAERDILKKAAAYFAKQSG
jgi:transposase